MPQPLDSTLPVHLVQHANVLEERPEIAFGIGMVSAAWAFLEASMVIFFSTISAEQVDGKFKPNALANDVFSSLDSFNARRGIVRKAFAQRFPKDWQARYSKLETRIKDCRDERNIAAHSVWAVSRHYPGQAITSVRGGPLMRYSIGDFKDLATKICQVEFDLGKFMLECMEYMRA